MHCIKTKIILRNTRETKSISLVSLLLCISYGMSVRRKKNKYCLLKKKTIFFLATDFDTRIANNITGEQIEMCEQTDCRLRC